MKKGSINELLEGDKLFLEMEEIINNTKITGHTKIHYLRNVAIQTWTQHIPAKNSKLEGCRYWSVDAFEQTFDPEYVGKKEKLNHEHVVPKGYLIDKVFLDDDKNVVVTKDYIEYHLEKITFACVVTKSNHDDLNRIERSDMPISFSDINSDDYSKTWLRYIMAGIEVYEVTWQGNVPTSKRIVDLTKRKA